jgi:hypothetical protein
LKLTSNIAAVQERLGRIPAALDVAIANTIAAPEWESVAKETAEKVLRQVATPDEKHFVSAFVARVSVTFGPALRVRMSAPLPTAELAYQPTFMGNLEFAGDADKVREWIEQWVATPYAEGGKRRDARDAGKSDEEIVELISRIMLTSEGAGYLVQSGKNKGQLARNVLLPHIAEFIAGQMKEYRLKPETVTLWLRTVLAAWRVVFREKFVSRLRVEFRKAVAA